MRGVIEHYDSKMESGLIGGNGGKLYPFSRWQLSRYSKRPQPGSVVVFRLNDGAVHKLSVVSHQQRHDLRVFVLEMIAYVVLAVSSI